MSIEVSLIASGLAAALPICVGKRLARKATPRQLIAFSTLCLVALCFGLIIILGAALQPTHLPTAELPGLVDRCLGAARELLSHPVGHWPRIFAALALVALVARLVYASIASTRDSLLVARDVIGPTGNTENASGSVLFVRTEELFAVAVRKRIVVSTGAWDRLDPSERTAVLTHERAHLRGAHSALLVAARTVVRAFPFVPPARLAARQLLLGLEMAADDAAVTAVGDPLVVARALEKLVEAAPLSPVRPPAAAESQVLERVARLLRPPDPSGARVSVGRVGLALAGAAVAGLLLVLPLSSQSLSAQGRDRAVHGVCHLPHPPDVTAPAS